MTRPEEGGMMAREVARQALRRPTTLTDSSPGPANLGWETVMKAVTPEVEFVGVRIAGCAMFPGDKPDDPPLILRDVPIVVIAPPFGELADAPDWGYADEMKLAMTITDDCAHIEVGLYEPWINFRVKVPLPECQEEIASAFAMGWMGIQDEDSEACLMMKIAAD